MKRIVFTTLLVMFFSTISTISTAQDIRNGNADNKTTTEQFDSKTGVVIIHGSEFVGIVNGSYQTAITVGIYEFKDVSSKQKKYGITVETMKVGNGYGADKTHKSYIDYAEIKSLIQGIDYISKVTKDVTKLRNFQAVYSTKSDLKVSTSSSGAKKVTISSGSTNGISADFDITSIVEVKELIAEAKAKLDSIK